MKLAVVAFTQAGAALAGQIAERLGQCTAFTPLQYAEGTIKPLTGTLSEWTKNVFEACEGIIFVGACGIAVRAIAPYIQNKLTDPAVVVVDEKAQFSISLLSGHVGGANKLAERVANAIHAQAVITTATDVNNIFSVDSWATQNGMVICNPECVKDISGALLLSKQVGLETQFAISGELPEGIVAGAKTECGICISLNMQGKPLGKTLLLAPAILHLGIGCRKGVSKEAIDQAVKSILEQNGFVMQSVKDVSSIDLKAQELGLLSFCETQGKPFHTYEPEQLADVDATVNASTFVQEVTGVDNVCERAALLAAGKDAKLLVSKQAMGPVTVAVAAEQWQVPFDS